MGTRNDGRSLGGYRYRAGIIGKFHFRVRESHVADHYVPLITAKQVGAVKLDMVLRGVGLLPAHAGKRPPGLVLPNISYEDLHDLCQPAGRYRLGTPEDEQYDPVVVRNKRNWVGRRLKILEDTGLIVRHGIGGGRPHLVVLKDDGSGKPFDDPDGRTGNSYVTLSGPVLAKWLRMWNAPEVAAYLAAVIADRYARNQAAGATPPLEVPVGGAEWFQTLHWFADPKGWRPAGHVRTGFSEKNLERGLRQLGLDGLITVTKTVKRPDRPGGHFKTGPRNIYRNHFAEIDAGVDTALVVPDSALADQPGND